MKKIIFSQSYDPKTTDINKFVSALKSVLLKCTTTITCKIEQEERR